MQRSRVHVFRSPIKVLAPSALLLMLLGPASAQFQQASAGVDHSLGLRCDGTVEAWGNNDTGQCNVPALPEGLVYVEVSAGGAREDCLGFTYGLSVARRSDGSVVAFGSGGSGQLDVPPLPEGLRYVGVAAGPFHALARRSDGSVVAWGNNTYGQCNVPDLPPGVTYLEISAGGWQDEYAQSGIGGGFMVSWPSHSVALRSDGAVLAWGSNSHGQTSVPTLPPGVSFVEVAAGSDHTIARLSDGGVIAWGDNSLGQLDVPPLPPGLTYSGVDAGGGVSVAWRSDGSAVSWGEPLLPVGGLPAGQALENLSVGGANYRWIWEFDVLPPQTGGYAYAHALEHRGDGTLVGWGADNYGQASVPAPPMAAETFRNAGTNPASYSAGLPILDSQWTARVDLTTTGHSHAAVIGHQAQATTTLAGGQALLLGGARVFSLAPKAGPVASWSVWIPNNCALAGTTVYTQAIHFGGGSAFALSNARDLFLGY